MNEINNNKVNLCDSCSQTYPECTSKPEDVYFGDGAGHDNICACSEYQPKSCGDGDTISRQDAIMAVKTGALSAATLFGRTDEGSTALYETVRAIKALPSAQHEIIRCRDCRFYEWMSNRVPEEQTWFCHNWNAETGKDDYCSYAERRQNETAQ